MLAEQKPQIKTGNRSSYLVYFFHMRRQYFKEQLWCTYIRAQLGILLPGSVSVYYLFEVRPFSMINNDIKLMFLVVLLSQSGNNWVIRTTHPASPGRSLLLPEVCAEFSLTAAHHKTLAQETQRGIESYTLHHLSGMCKQSENWIWLKAAYIHHLEILPPHKACRPVIWKAVWAGDLQSTGYTQRFAVQ